MPRDFLDWSQPQTSFLDWSGGGSDFQDWSDTEETEEERRKRLLEEEESVLEKSLHAVGRGLSTGVSGALETFGNITAAPSRALWIQDEPGDRRGADWLFKLADTIEKWAPEEEKGLGYKLLEMAGSVPGTLLKYSPAAVAGVATGGAAIPAMAVGAGAMGAIDAASSFGEGDPLGEALKEGLVSGAEGLALGAAGKMASPLKRALAGATTMGVGAGVRGGEPEDILTSALAGGVMGAAFRDKRPEEPKTSVRIPEDKLPGQDLVGTPTLGELVMGPDLKPRKGQPNDFPINLSRRMAPQEVHDTALAVAEMNKEALNKNRETVTMGELDKLAASAGSPEELISWFADSEVAKLPERTLAMRQAQGRFAQEMAELDAQKSALAAAGKDTPELFAALDEQRRTAAGNLVAMYHTLSKTGSSWGRTGAVLGRIIGPDEPWQRALWQLTKRGKASTELVDAIYKAKDSPDELAAVLRTATKPAFADKAYEVWLNGILSGVKTHVVNNTSNALMQGLSAVERPISGAVSAVQSALSGKPRERYIGEFFADAMGVVEGAKAGIVAAKKSYQGAGDLGKLENIRALPDKVLGVPTPGMTLQIEDEFWKALAATRELYAQAYRKSRQEGKGRVESLGSLSQTIDDLAGKEGKEWRDILGKVRKAAEADRLVRKAGGEGTALGQIAQAAEASGKRQTFTTAPGTWAESVMHLRDSIPGMRYVIPFIQTPANILKTAVEYTPVSAVKALAGKQTGGELADTIARASIGSVLTIPVLDAAFNGYVTGGGPADYDLLQNKRQTGWQPYSIAVPLKSGTKYFSFERLEPFATVLGVVADLNEVRDEETGRNMAQKAVAALSDNVTNKTFLQGLENIFKITSDPYRWFGTIGKNYVGSAVPSLFGQIASAIDEDIRDVSFKRGSTIGDVLQSRIPGASKELPTKVSPTGKPIEKTGTVLNRLLSPVAISQEQPGMPVEREFSRIGYVPDITKDYKVQIGKETVLLNDAEKDLMRQAYARAAAEVEKSMAHPGWKRLPDAPGAGPDKRDIIQQIYSRYRQWARNQIIANRLLGR